jgi:hypothetical protein
MAVKNIPDDHHVVRHCKKRQTIRENGVAIRIFPEAFLLRPANPPLRPEPEIYLSTSYYEHYSGTPQQMMAQCCAALAFVPKNGDSMARLNAGLLREVFKKQKTGVRVTHEGKRSNPGYAAIRPAKVDQAIAAMIAGMAVVEIADC